MQGPVSRPPRAERKTTSCGECRRRKQKCDQRQPCSNCARRFPQPACEYRQRLRRPSATAISQQPTFSAASPPMMPRSLASLNPPQPPAIAQPPLISPFWYQRRPSQNAEEAAPTWSIYGLANHHNPTSSNPEQHAWNTDQLSLSMSVVACHESCTLHSDEVHEAIRLLHEHPSSTQPSAASDGWTQPGYSAWTLVPAAAVQEPGGVPWSMGDPRGDLIQMPVARPMGDAELLTIFTKFVSQFTASLDGKPDPSNPYIKHYVPYFVDSPLLSRIAIYSAACFLTDSGHVDWTTAMAHKGRVFKLLNEHIRSQPSATDDVISGVVQIALDEWLWGNIHDLKAHLRGLSEMIRSRGGFDALGHDGIVSKRAIACDVAVAMSFEAPPFLRGRPEFEFHDGTPAPFRLPLNTPFVLNLASFSSCSASLRVHEAAASILDDMRFLLSLILALPKNPSIKDLQKIHDTSAWIHGRITSLPEDSPGARWPSAAGLAPSPGPLPSPNPALRDEQQISEARHLSPSPHQPSQRQPPNPSISSSPLSIHSQPSAPSLSPRQPTSSTFHQPLEQDPPADYIYQSVRHASLLYTRAIIQRRPFSSVVTSAEFFRLWTTVWRVPLATWRSLLGVFNWVLLPALSGGRAAQPHDRFVKGLMKFTLFQMGMENWDIAEKVMKAATKLQEWLSTGGGEGDGGR
ncbi:hypothetical protein VTJ83DRAFT_7411 [Remersonia thermophila]|uniref:Zn(2)-C6 fungal-type domain-containing protein n=1 Tax=Remersonia thermophila TaxID=72144 RepID=A0ABR4D3E2_9PEZI